ncbi:hypothetical protein NFI96_006425 [Prochilodus magdalenae]|nr:hypothetical protein NFI96_006425 [Prochilodus magdalenae]
MDQSPFSLSTQTHSVHYKRRSRDPTLDTRHCWTHGTAEHTKHLLLIADAEMILSVVLLLPLLSVPGLTASTENLAAGGKAVQSTTADEIGDAQKAVDGKSDTYYRRGSCTHTSYESNPWWRVELQGVYNVSSVSVTNRGDCCGQRINGAQIRIGNSLENNGNDNKLCVSVETFQLQNHSLRLLSSQTLTEH